MVKRLNPLRFAYLLSAIIKAPYPRTLNKAFSLADRSISKLQSVTGIRQFCHPDLINMDGKIFLALTPYPYGVDLYENPEVFGLKHSNAWESIDLVNQPGRSKYLSDPELIIIDSELWLIYRETQRKESGSDKVILRKTGKYNKSVLLTGIKNSLLSPSSIYDGSYYIYVVDASRERHELYRYEFDKTMRFCGKTRCQSDIEKLWHIDIIKNGRRIEGLFLSEKNSKHYKNSLFLVESEDNGLTFKKKREIELFENDIQMIYRASMAKTEEEALIAISYRTKEDKWRVRFYKFEGADPLTGELERVYENSTYCA